MKRDSEFYDTLSFDDIDKLEKQNKTLKDNNIELEIQVQELNQIVDSLKQQIQEHAQLINTGTQLQQKVKTLSKFTLRLARNTLQRIPAVNSGQEKENQSRQAKQQKNDINKLKEKQNQELTNYKKEIAELKRQLFNAQQYTVVLEQQLKSNKPKVEYSTELSLCQSQRILTENTYEKQLLQASLKQYQYALKDKQLQIQQKDNTIKDLKLKLQTLRDQYRIENIEKQQAFICKSWGINPATHTYKLPEQYQSNLKLRIKNLEEQQKELQIIFINERDIVETLRKSLESKEKELIEKEKLLKLQEIELREKNIRLEQNISKKQEQLQENYSLKIKSIRQFNTDLQNTDKKNKYQQVISSLKAKVEQEAKKNAQLLSQILSLKTNNPSSQKTIPAEKVIELELISIMNNYQNQTKRILQLRKRQEQIINFICMQVEQIEQQKK